MRFFMAEMIGTLLMVLLGDGVVAAVLLAKSKAEKSGWIVITTGWAMAVVVGVYTVGRISGAYLNPALTVGYALAGRFPWQRVLPYIAGQMAGAFLGAVLVWVVYYAHWRVTEDPTSKLLVFCTVPAIRHKPANVATEMIATSVLAFGCMALGANRAPMQSGITPLLIGFLVWAIGLSLGGPTGYAINPARDLAPRLAHAILPIPGKGTSDWGYAWVPIAGPLIGGALGALAYSRLL